jgi:DNA mismatch repair enzyme (predicted ATPase)
MEENLSAKKSKEFDNPPDPGRVIEGLRDTGYDFNTAIADIVDNSIAANATNVDINITMTPSNDIIVYIADNGEGMDFPKLVNAMKYGSERRADPSSLGKFGLGLKTASTAFCRKLSLVSKIKTDPTIRKVQWDLDYVASAGWKLKELQPNEDELDMLDMTAQGGSGTLVIWENVDRLLNKAYSKHGDAINALKKIKNSLTFHLSAVYQRFLDHNDTRAANVTITLDGNAVKPWDPFCTKEANTELLTNMPIEVSMPDGTTADITLKAYAIPRQDDFSSTAASREARVSADYEGFYIYRENRLIHYGDPLGMFVKDSHLALLRIDFSFDYRFDDAFNVDIKKSRILLNEQVYEIIYGSFIAAPKNAANLKYRKGVNSAVSSKSKDAHAASNRNIEEKASGVEAAKVTVTNAAESEVEIHNQNGVFKHKITIKDAVTPGQYRVIPVDSIEGNVLWEPTLVDGHTAVSINKNHPYYQKVYFPVLQESVLVTGMDALLWALAEAELSTFNDETREVYEEVRIQVSRALKKLVADLPAPEAQED